MKKLHYFSVGVLVITLLTIGGVWTVNFVLAQDRSDSTLQTEPALVTEAEQIQLLEQELGELFTKLDYLQALQYFGADKLGIKAASSDDINVLQLRIVESYTQIIDYCLSTPCSLAASSNLSSYYNNRGVLYAEIGQYTKAIEDANMALHLSADNLWFLKNRATTYEQAGDLDAALIDYQKFMAVTANFPESAWGQHREFVTERLQTLLVEQETEEISQLSSKTYLPIVVRAITSDH